MLLYATTTSERASKGQGGNEFIKTDITFNEKLIARLELKKNNAGEFILGLIEFNENEFGVKASTIWREKGKSQKGEIDYTCPKCKNGQSKPNRVWCDNCINNH